MQVELKGTKIELLRGDITDQDVDAIVDAANSRLAGGGGVDGAIHGRGGPAIMEETSRRFPNGCPTGSAVLSGAGRLAARYVIHAVGPVYHGGNQGEPDLLASTYRKCLELADEHACRSVAFPAISTGAYGFPLDEAAHVALSTVIDHMTQHGKPELVRFVLFGEAAYEMFIKVLRELTS